MELAPAGNFWQYHGILFCLFMMLFPRLTMLIAGICFAPFAGFLFWLGWIFLPRMTVAILATIFYFATNPILCVFVWLWACCGEVEKKQITTYHEF